MIDQTNSRATPLALIVDDDLSLRLTMTAALKKAGFKVVAAENGRRALSLFHSEKPDLIMLDVIMPEMDGFETCAAIREKPEGEYPQILMVTGLGDIESIERAFEVGAEALIRWRHPTKGMILPDRFIHIAEESSLIIDINKWVLKTACRQSRQWLGAGLPPARIAVNLSGYRVAGQNIIDSIQTALQAAALDAGLLEVEITENVLLHATEETISTFQQMKNLRIRIALDDFGTGYSSLSYLTAFPVDTLKIDRSFVAGCAEKKKNRIIIKAIAAMGHSMGMKIVAEGIENATQFEIIKGYGCDEAQGYYFSPPVSQEEFTEILKKGVL